MPAYAGMTILLQPFAPQGLLPLRKIEQARRLFYRHVFWIWQRFRILVFCWVSFLNPTYEFFSSVFQLRASTDFDRRVGAGLKPAPTHGHKVGLCLYGHRPQLIAIPKSSRRGGSERQRGWRPAERKSEDGMPRACPGA